MAQRNTSDAWDGPSAREMINTHTLAKEIIARHKAPCPVFDDKCILELRRFVQYPSQSRAMLQDMGMLDAEGDKLGAAASNKGSLTGYIMAT